MTSDADSGWRPTIAVLLAILTPCVLVVVVSLRHQIWPERQPAGPVVAPPVAEPPVESATPDAGPAEAVADPPVAASPPPSGAVIQSFVSADGAHEDARRAPLLALAVPDGTAAAARIPPGPFRATLDATLDVPLRDRFRFAVEGRGEVAVEVGGKEVLTASLDDGRSEAARPVRLSKGGNPIRIRFRSRTQGDATLRVLWSSSEFGWEPIPPSALTLPADAGDADGGFARGRDLFAASGCARCHRDDSGALAMPELAASAPELTTIGGRVRPQWLRTWLSHPVAPGVRGRRMPHLFGDDAVGHAEIDDVVAFLVGPEPRPEVGFAGDADRGGTLFAQLGCVACHRLEPRPVDDDDDRVPLLHAGQKLRPGALMAQAQDATRHDPWSPMPRFLLSDGDAADLAAHLMAVTGVVGDGSGGGGDAGRGRALVAARGCANCHELADVPPAPAPALAAIFGAARAADAEPCAGPVRYRFAAGERDDLRTFLTSADALASLRRRVAAADAERALHRLRCAACHRLDGGQDAWSRYGGAAPAAGDGDHGPAQDRPDLTWAGDKLRHRAIHAYLTGAASARARPWLHARMPAFPAFADVLADGLGARHGRIGDGEAPPARDADAVAMGEALVGAGTGFACVTCHGIGEQPPVQVFEVQGVNFALPASRLRRDYFLRWMANPQRVDPSSKMPRYADANGKTGLTQYASGDAGRQFEAIWQWLHSLDG